MSNLRLTRINDSLWLITTSQTDAVVAEIHLDPWNQVDEVVLHADSSEEIQLEVLRLAFSHAKQYVRHRISPAFGDLAIVEHGNHELTREDSDLFMNFSAIPPEIKEMDRETIVNEFNAMWVSITVAVHRQVAEAIHAIVCQVGIEDLGYEVVPQKMVFHDEKMVRFSVKEPGSFTFWTSEMKPSGGSFDLHIIPSYHPIMSGQESVGLVNGDTDAYISGHAVKSIYCPEDAQAIRDSFGATWEHVNHPFRATGRTVKMCLVTTKIRSAEGVNELTQLLRAALGLDKKYVAISGGFQAPLICPENRLSELGRRSPWPEADYERSSGNKVRGSEGHCVWAYQILKEEGKLDGSFVPPWFIKEGWLQIYEGAEVRPGLY